VTEHCASCGGEVSDEPLGLRELPTCKGAPLAGHRDSVIVAVDRRRGSPVQENVRAAGEICGDCRRIGTAAFSGDHHLSDVPLGQRSLPRGDLEHGGMVLRPRR
jgi:hypothetical protein